MKHYSASAALLLGLALAGCGGGSSDAASPVEPTPTPEPSVKTLSVDASAGGFGAGSDDPANKYTYVNLASGAVVALTDAEAAASTDWHIAFKRANAPKLNGGASGPGAVQGALADAQADFYNADGNPDLNVFLNAGADAELAAFEAVTSAGELSFASDAEVPAIAGDGTDAGWWLYDFASHTVSANADAWWLVRSAGGASYAKFHVTDIGQAERDISLELYLQGATDSAFADTPVSYTASLGADGGEACYDFDTAAEADCAGDAWDLKLEVSADGRSWNIWSNGGVSGGGQGAAYGVLSTAAAAGYSNGTTTSGDYNFSGHYQADAAGGVFVANTWYAYNLQQQHKLWPNYRVYLLKDGDSHYKLQILSYYDAAGTSGVLSVRYGKLD